MKKIKYIVAALLITGPLLVTALARAAGGNAYPIRLTALSSSAANDGASSITFKVYTYVYRCSDGGAVSSPSACSTVGDGSPGAEYPLDNKEVVVTVTGTNNTLAGLDAANKIRTDTSGYAQFTLASTAAEAKTVSAQYTTSSSVSSASVTFTAPQAASTPTPTPTPTPPSTPRRGATTTPPAPTPTPPPTVPQLGMTSIAGQLIQTDQKVNVPKNTPLRLSGKVLPNGIVTLYIFSEPKMAKVTADANGDWSYSIEGLPAGDHHVEAEVTDPVTNMTSQRAQLLAFTVEKAALQPVSANANDNLATPSKSKLILPIVTALTLVVVGLCAYIGWYRWKHGVLPRPLSIKKHTV